MKLLIYTPRITSRIRYIVDYIFRDYLLFYCTLTDSEDEFRTSQSVKLSYSNGSPDNVLLVPQHPLLLEDNIKQQEIDLLDYEGVPAFFAVDAQGSPFPFDIFAASFYLITRYEEYLAYTPDKFGRYSPRNALAFKGNFLDKPLVNIWAKMLFSELQKRYPGEVFPKRKFDYLPTYNIDQPYAYVHRNVFVNLGGVLKSLAQNRFREAKGRFLVMIHYRKDQFDTYGFQFALQQHFGFNPCYFVLCAQQTNSYEHAFSCDSRRIKKLMRRIKSYGKIGIHLSFASASDKASIGREIRKFSGMIYEQIEMSRQHYLLLTMPQTYQSLVDSGIKEDYSMGYASRPGFRASVSTPFKWFDLSKNEKTSLTIYPFAYMDGALNHSLKLQRADAEQLIKKLTSNVKAVDGLFISLWHNSSLSNSGSWSGWRAVYKHSIEYADSLCEVLE
ncbi:MAG: hypothetical protein H6Q17_2410 [Bacteroidetes bacterium]|nr:hypothetical protein [Bacteroidota bacterium]